MTTFTRNSTLGQSALVATYYGPILIHLSIDLDERPGRNETQVFGGFRDPSGGGATGEQAATKDGPQVAWSALVQGF